MKKRNCVAKLALLTISAALLHTFPAAAEDGGFGTYLGEREKKTEPASASKPKEKKEKKKKKREESAQLSTEASPAPERARTPDAAPPPNFRLRLLPARPPAISSLAHSLISDSLGSAFTTIPSWQMRTRNRVLASKMRPFTLTMIEIAYRLSSTSHSAAAKNQT